jgi:CheY-specific phosphatase CheX
METQIYDSFCDATTQVLTEIGFTSIKLVKADRLLEDRDFMVTIGLTGDLIGFFILETAAESALIFLEKMFKNLGVIIEEEGFGKMHKEALAEVVNQVAGRSLMVLSKKKIECSISPPTILSGENLVSSIPMLTKFFRTHIHGNFGKIGLYIGLKTT